MSFLIFLISFFSGINAHCEPTDQALRRFFKNPAAFRKAVPEKFLNEGLTLSPGNGAPRFSPEEKIRSRLACSPSGQAKTFAVPGPQDRPEPFLEGQPLETRLEDLESSVGPSGQVAQEPWSGDYWPIAHGSLGAREFDDGFSALEDWLTRFQYIQKNPANEIFLAGDSDRVQRLSVSEKYDLLIGATEGLLTPRLWKEGKAYQDQYGKVEEWMGLCHGWAPASFMVDRPISKISVTAPDGKTALEFKPDELKGLMTYQWAVSDVPAFFAGGRCNDKDPKRDSAGRIVDADCMDTNPATWHLLITHLVGLMKQSFVMDATFDYEVWNQPVVEYRLEYFNPITQRSVPTLKDGLVKLSDFAQDPFKRHRPSEARSLVGVAMKVRYAVETSTTDKDVDGPEWDQFLWVRYFYDLELDSEGRVMGGEWYQEQHPDFLWAPARGSVAESPLDRGLSPSHWEKGRPLPASWQARAQIAAKRNGQLLNSVLQNLLLWSRE